MNERSRLTKTSNRDEGALTTRAQLVLGDHAVTINYAPISEAHLKNICRRQRVAGWLYSLGMSS